jgi:hypothetical protein
MRSLGKQGGGICLVQILPPLRDKSGKAFSPGHFQAVGADPGPYDVYIELYVRGPRLIGLATSYPTPEAPFGARLSYPVTLAHRP